ncbi:MarR family transcriptional regulator [Paenibacillus sp. JMULE4]|uniref:MarR family winged helix-turn-helix transcriptional regulator n=1 Tax=Paenibacillus TaxID=44249 RepID=UPI0015754B44|nr:MarR family winged helix-turn-helix transcriptional regulator [Paenibacillus sp. JMULE4]NTZ16889.1 MarR family transcriptional regulator [Paenibacillus sp. JMULE4]
MAYRESSEPDARVRWVKLTEEGKRVIRQTKALWAQTLSEPFEQFSEAERQQFLEFMHRLSEALPAKKA